MNKYQLSSEQRKRFAGLYLLEYMINTPYTPPIFLEGNDQDLEEILAWMMAEEWISIFKDSIYIPTEKGRLTLKNFMARYSEYLTMFDIYCAVDLQEGEFAFSYWNEFEDDDAFRAFLNEDRWDDLRIAVAEYKKMDPVEIVFMSFINEGRFGRNESGWQFDLLLGSVWDEILEICDTAIHWRELGYEDEQGRVDARDVIEDIIVQGTEIMLELLGDAYHPAPPAHDADSDAEYVVESVDLPEYDSTHYRKYLDPKYKSKNWIN
ncbi:MAG: hypothetical protein D6677_08750 [Calditrichaeota bacterium]|nr:MAG: hypothetical protein D6677_08750 [Calditrichota bacterium]